MRWVAGALACAAMATAWGCTIDPGPNFVVPLSVFNEDFFYCHVEPEYLFTGQTQCGAGQAGDNGNCHFNSSAVSGMTLQDHAPIDCGGGDHPTAAGKAASGPGSAANNNFSSASLEMLRDCVDSNCQAPILRRPTDTTAHPRQIFQLSDPTLPNVIFTWATTP